MTPHNTTSGTMSAIMFLVHTLRAFVAFVLACPATGDSFSLSGTILGLLSAVGFLYLSAIIVRIIRDAINTNI